MTTYVNELRNVPLSVSGVDPERMIVDRDWIRSEVSPHIPVRRVIYSPMKSNNAVVPTTDIEAHPSFLLTLKTSIGVVVFWHVVKNFGSTWSGLASGNG